MKNILLLMLLCLSFSGMAQKIKLVEGNLSAVKGQKALNTEFSYENMAVGKYDKEQDYIARKKAEYNEKEPGSGEKWEKAWVNDRKERFEPQFRELFATHSALSTVDEKATYTMIVHTIFTEVGFNVGVASKPAYINLEVTIVETKNRDKIIAKLTIMKAPGRAAFGYDFETGLRLAEAYAKSGKELGQFFESTIGK